MSKFETSVSNMKASFDAIEAAKNHTIVLDAPPKKSVAGATEKIITKNTTKTIAKINPIGFTKQPEGVYVCAGNKPAKKAVVKSTKLRKLLKGRTTFEI